MSRVSVKQVAGVIVDMLASSPAKPEKLAQGIARYLTEQSRTKDLAAVLRAVEELRAASGTYEATTTSSFPLDSDVHSEIVKLIKRARPTAKHVLVNETRDSEMIGGVRVESQDLLFDTTFQHKLRQLTAAYNNED